MSQESPGTRKVIVSKKNIIVETSKCQQEQFFLVEAEALSWINTESPAFKLTATFTDFTLVSSFALLISQDQFNQQLKIYLVTWSGLYKCRGL